MDPPSTLPSRSASRSNASEASFALNSATAPLLKHPTSSVEHGIFSLLLQGNYAALQ